MLSNFNDERASFPLSYLCFYKCIFSVLPGVPEHLKTIKIGQNSVRLKWEKPKYFELLKCTGFIISKRHSTTEEWQKIEKVEPHISSYLVSNLPYRDVYFSVAAENVVGIGHSAETKKAEALAYPKGRYITDPFHFRLAFLISDYSIQFTNS